MASNMYTWKSSDDWAGVAWNELGEETRYRDIIEANPGFSPVKFPAVGTEILIPEVGTNQDQTLDNEFFPWQTREQALDRLQDYNAIAILLKDQINGVRVST